MVFRWKRTSDSDSPHWTTFNVILLGKLDFHWTMTDRWCLAETGPRIRILHIKNLERGVTWKNRYSLVNGWPVSCWWKRISDPNSSLWIAYGEAQKALGFYDYFASITSKEVDNVVSWALRDEKEDEIKLMIRLNTVLWVFASSNDPVRSKLCDRDRNALRIWRSLMNSQDSERICWGWYRSLRQTNVTFEYGQHQDCDGCLAD